MSSSPSPLRALDTFAVFVACLLLYLALGQETFYRSDGRHALKLLLSGLPAHPNHFFYLPALRGAHALGGATFSLYQCALFVSQAGCAVGVALFHRASLSLGLSRGGALLVAALVATTPGVVFFASVVELHGLFLAFAGVAAWSAARFAARPGWRTAVVFGVATGLAVGAHATGHLLPLAFLPLAFRDAQRPVLPVAIVCAAHAATALLLPSALRALGVPVHGGAALTFILTTFAQHGLPLDAIPSLLWCDWIAPFAPLALLPWFAWRRARNETIGLGVGLVGYLGATMMLLGSVSENGAYVLPLVWPAALLSVRALRPWLCVAAAVVGLGLGVRWVAVHEDSEFSRAFATAARELEREAPSIFFAGALREFDAFFIHAPELKWKDPIDDAGLPPEAIPVAMRMLESWVRTQKAAGVRVFLTEGVFEYLKAPIGPHPETGPVLARAYADTFDLVPVERGVLRARRVEPR